MEFSKPNEVIDKCKALSGYWRARDSKFKDWYSLLQLTDSLKETDMESFVSNEPRTFFNLARHLLCGKIPHRIPSVNLEDTDVKKAADIEKFFETAWKDNDRRLRMMGKQSWLWYFVSLLLARGWYAVFVLATKERCYAEIYDPAEIFPEYGPDGLTACSRIYTVTKDGAIRLANANGWKLPPIVPDKVTVYSLWYLNDSSKPAHSVVFDNDYAKPPTNESFESIPILIGPVGGLPDSGIVTTGDEWKGTVGESILATNEKLYNTYNKQWSFAMQLLRDTAQSRWFEKSRTGDILKPQDLFKRGAIFKGSPEDSIEILATPPIPVELRTDRFDLSQQMQRGSMSWALWGNLQGQITSYLMSQIAASAQQALRPYHMAIVDCLSDIDNMWLAQVEQHSFKPYEMTVPKKIKGVEATAEYDIQVPGDLVQRATVARMLDPDFRLSNTTVIDLAFPEIKNALQEQAQVRNDRAMQNPISVVVNLIVAYRRKAVELQKTDPETSQLYANAASALEQQLSPQAGPPQGPEAAVPPGARPEVRGPRIEYPPVS